MSIKFRTNAPTYDRKSVPGVSEFEFTISGWLLVTIIAPVVQDDPVPSSQFIVRVSSDLFVWYLPKCIFDRDRGLGFPFLVHSPNRRRTTENPPICICRIRIIFGVLAVIIRYVAIRIRLGPRCTCQKSG
jgi:hypothetical protein